MSIFKRKDPTMPVTGIEALRRKVVVCTEKPGVPRALVRDIEGLGLTDIQEFAVGLRDLKIEILQALAKELFNARLNDDGLLQSLNTAEAKPLCAANYPPSIDPKSSPYYVPPRDRNAPRIGPQPVKPEPVRPKGPRPSWA